MQSDPDQYDLLSSSYALVYLDFSISVERTAELTAIIATAAAAAVPAIKKIKIKIRVDILCLFVIISIS